MNVLALAFLLLLFAGFGYNMTQDMEKETRLLQACIAFNLELPACDEIYGSIPK